jgi:hypothetical protein
MAGSLLWYVYHMKHCNLAEPSLTQARKICLSHSPKRFKQRVGRPTKNEVRNVNSYNQSKLKGIWRDFSSVAHLWAAFLTLNQDVVQPTDMPLETIDLNGFLCCAQHFADFAANFVIPRSRGKKLLDKDELIELPIKGHRSLNSPGAYFINPHVKNYVIQYLKKP